MQLISCLEEAREALSLRRETSAPTARELEVAEGTIAQLKTEGRILEGKAAEMAAELVQRNQEMDDLERLFSQGTISHRDQRQEHGADVTDRDGRLAIVRRPEKSAVQQGAAPFHWVGHGSFYSQPSC